MFSSPARPLPSARIPALDVLRGVLALMVAVYHFFVMAHPFTGPLRDLIVVGGVYAVQGFFMLSGVCFFYRFGDEAPEKVDWGHFYLRRFMRLAPLFYVTIVLSALFLPHLAHELAPLRWLENLSLTFGFVHPNHALVPGGWSIGVEVVFYCALPLCLWLARSAQGRIALLVCGIALCVPSNFGGIAAAPELQRFHRYVAVSNHAFLFLLGGAVAELRRRWRVRLKARAVLLPMALFAALVVWAQPTFYDHFDVMVGWPRITYVVLTLLVVAVAACVTEPLGRAWKPWLWLGDWSYSVYLVHPFAWLALHRVAPGALSPIASMLLGLALTLAISACTHRLIERPGQALGERLARARLTPRGDIRRPRIEVA